MSREKFQFDKLGIVEDELNLGERGDWVRTQTRSRSRGLENEVGTCLPSAVIDRGGLVCPVCVRPALAHLDEPIDVERARELKSRAVSREKVNSSREREKGIERTAVTTLVRAVGGAPLWKESAVLCILGSVGPAGGGF